MFISELFEEFPPKRIIAVLPGRFSPFHIGHKSGYDFLVEKFGVDNVWVATSNKVEPPRSPFSFEEKATFIAATGIPTDKIIQTRNPYKAEELTMHFDPDNTVLVFGVSAKDMEEDPRFNFAPKRDGSPSYFQPWPADGRDLEPLNKHGYIITVPTINFSVAGAPMRSASEFRQNFGLANTATRKQMVKDMFGTFNPAIYRILMNKLLVRR